jgi:hypothetical protein
MVTVKDVLILLTRTARFFIAHAEPLINTADKSDADKPAPRRTVVAQKTIK